MIRHNLGYKLIALCVALALWSYVNSERNPQARRVFTVPIEVPQIEGYMAEPDIHDANITINGTKSAVDAVSREEVKASVNLAGADKTGQSTVVLDVQPSLNDTEGDLDISVSPKKVRVTLEERGDKRLPVEPRFPAVPPLGYAYGNPVINPASVRVYGKISEVARVRKVALTLPSERKGTSIDGSFAVTPLDARGIPVTGVTTEPDKVSLKLELMEVPASKSVIVSPDVTGVPAFPAKVSSVNVTPSLITLQGRPATLTGITTISTDRIDIDGTTGKVVREVSLHLPRGVTTTGRSTVRVTIDVTSSDTQ